MEEVLRNSRRRRRVYPIQPYASLYTHFPQKYMSYLLPALLQATMVTSYGGSKEMEIEKKVRLEVDMALVLSAGSFRWSRALRRKLEQDMSTRRPHRSVTMGVLSSKGSNHFGIASGFEGVLSSPSVPRPLVPADATRPRRVRGGRRSTKAFGVEEEMLCRVRVLRRILPGGSEMGVCELLSEVESYVVCLQLQVNILRSLVAAN